jgi:hypothetical protein
MFALAPIMAHSGAMEKPLRELSPPRIFVDKPVFF